MQHPKPSNFPLIKRPKYQEESSHSSVNGALFVRQEPSHFQFHSRFSNNVEFSLRFSHTRTVQKRQRAWFSFIISLNPLQVADRANKSPKSTKKKRSCSTSFGTEEK